MYSDAGRGAGGAHCQKLTPMMILQVATGPQQALSCRAVLRATHDRMSFWHFGSDPERVSDVCAMSAFLASL